MQQGCTDSRADLCRDSRITAPDRHVTHDPAIRADRPCPARSWAIVLRS